MTYFTGQPGVFGSLPPIVDEANPQHDLGAKMYTADGRGYRYVRAGGSALVVGDLIQGIAEDTGEQGETPEATAIGAKSITTNSTVTVTANQYAGGYVIVTITPGLGQILKIKSHPAATAAALVITLEDPVQVALTTTSRIDLVANPYSAVIQNPSSASSSVVGVAVNNISISQYGWIQTDGIASVLADGALTVGTQLVASNGTNGAVESGADATDLQAIVGTAATGIATGDCGAVKLNIG